MTSQSTQHTLSQKNGNFGWLATLIALCIVFYRFRDYILNPGRYTTSIRGDGMITLRNMIWHVKYDKYYTKLDSMNYPDGEFIFMTDVNGVISSILKFINTHIIDISDSIPQIFRYFVYAWLIAGTYIMYRVLKRLNVLPLLSAILAPAIILMAPEMLRIVPHLSQGFPFVIPLATLWWLRKVRVQKSEWIDIVFFLLYAGIFLNNVYISTIALSFVLATSIIHTWWTDRDWRFPLLGVVLPILVTILGLYGYIKWNDPYTDRLKIQWGFFAYRMYPQGYLYPEFSLLKHILSNWVKVQTLTIEKSMSVGFVAGVCSLFLLIKNTFGRVFRAKIERFHPEVIAMFIAALCMLIYAMNSYVFPFLEDIGEDNMGPLLMFKASARFGRPMYYVMGIMTAIVLTQMLRRTNSSWHGISFAFAVLWLCESMWFTTLGIIVEKYDNPYREDQIAHIENLVDSLQLNTDNYQAMYYIPLFQGWHENMMGNDAYWTEIIGNKLTIASGIPSIHSKHSRNSTEATLRSAQMISSPLIKRRVLDILPNDKDLLILSSPHHKLHHEGETYMISLGDTIYSDENFTLQRLPLDTIRAYKIYNHVLERAQSNNITKPQYPYYHKSYDNTLKKGMYGNGGKLHKGEHHLDTINIHLDEDRIYTLTHWHLLKSEKYGVPEYFIDVDAGNDRYDKYLTPRECRNVYGDWLQMYIDLPLKAGNNRISIRYRTNQDFTVDELLLREKYDTIVRQLDIKSGILVNGFILK